MSGIGVRTFTASLAPSSSQELQSERMLLNRHRFARRSAYTSFSERGELEPVAACFVEPTTDPALAWAREFTRAMRASCDSQLEAEFDAMMRTQKGPRERKPLRKKG